MIDWDQFTCRVIIDASQEACFDAWTSEASITQWFVAECPAWGVDGTPNDSDRVFEVGGHIRLTWGEGTTDDAAIFVLNADDHFAFGWYEGKGRIDVLFSQFEGRTLVELHQVMSQGELEDRQKCALFCYSGWTFYLANLKAWLEHGIDLREHQSPKTKHLITI